MAGGRWTEESKQETPYDGGEDEGVKDGIRSYLVVSMLAYEKSKRIWEKEKGREVEWKERVRTAFIAERRVRRKEERDRESKRKREGILLSRLTREIVCGCEGESEGVESPDQLDEMKRETW